MRQQKELRVLFRWRWDSVGVTISRNNDNVISFIQNVQYISRRCLPERDALGQWWEMTYNNNENE